MKGASLLDKAFAGICAALLCAGVWATLADAAAPASPEAPAAAASLTPAAVPAPSGPHSRAQDIIPPLREIGRIRARTPYCRAFLSSAGPAVDSAIAFESALLDTIADMRGWRLDNALHKHRDGRRVEKDLGRLADLALLGRAELNAVSTLSDDDGRNEEAKQFRDALDGAKARQLDLARKLARQYGITMEAPVYSNVTLPGDRDAGAFAAPGDVLSQVNRPQAAPSVSADRLDQQSTQLNFDLRNGIFEALPGDERVGDDLARAAEHGKRVMAMAGC